MFDSRLVLGLAFLLVMMALVISMFISLIRLGDERRQLIVGKASTFTLFATMGGLVIGIIESIVKVQPTRVNSFTTLTAAAIIYFISLLYYKRRYGN